MKIHYTCNTCGRHIDTIEIDRIDEAKFGFDRLTAEERQDLITVDAAANIMLVQSICDGCIEALGLPDEAGLPGSDGYLH